MPKLKLIYTDDELMIIDKPAGLIVTPSDTTKQQTVSDLLVEQFKIQLDRGGVVHRLDKDTSGLLLVAKTQSALETLQLQFKERMVKKEYLCLVHGFLEGEGVISGAIDRNPRNRQKFTVLESGRDAKTGYSTISKFKIPNSEFDQIFNDLTKIQARKLERTSYNQFTLLTAFPQTGRTHQIRVHLKYLGFPIVGDDKYGGRRTSRLDKRWCPRQFLHAGKISFYHPSDGRLLTFESPLPEDLKKVLDILKNERSFS